MFGRRLPKNRRFSYEPLYYNPEKEEKEGRRIKFQRKTRRSTARMRSLVWLFILLGVVLYVIYILGRTTLR